MQMLEFMAYCALAAGMFMARLVASFNGRSSQPFTGGIGTATQGFQVAKKGHLASTRRYPSTLSDINNEIKRINNFPHIRLLY
jgi:hypothetical protein